MTTRIFADIKNAKDRMARNENDLENEMGDVTGVRAELVAKFKREVQNKTYRVKSEEIAAKITQKLKEEEAEPTTKTSNRWTA